MANKSSLNRNEMKFNEKGIVDYQEERNNDEESKNRIGANRFSLSFEFSKLHLTGKKNIAHSDVVIDICIGND